MNDNNNITMLVAEAKEGNQAAYESLYQKTKQMVYFTCFGLLNSEADAQDRMQETYATAFQKLDMLDDPEKFPGWINRIAINKCKDFLIWQKRWLSLSEEKDIPEEIPETEEDFLPEAYLMQQDKREIVQRIIREELSDVQFRTVILYYYDELSLTEIAKCMECSEGTVKSRLYKAKELIRKGVQKYSQENDDKLYSIALLPFLSRLLQLEAEHLQAPALNPNCLQNTKGQNPANQQTLKQHLQQDAKLKQGKGRLMMEQKGLLSTTAGKAIAVTASLLVIGGGIAGFLAITNHDEQRTESQGNYNQENTGQDSNNQETADEALERLNEELIAIAEAEQREEEERQQQLEEGYPEGVFPEGEYKCSAAADYYIECIYAQQKPSQYFYFEYEYNSNTGQYIINYDVREFASIYTDHVREAEGRRYHLEGYLNEKGNLIINYCACYNYDKLWEIEGIKVGYARQLENRFQRFDNEEYVINILEDIEWEYVLQEE